jgi:hypothetical protein
MRLNTSIPDENRILFQVYPVSTFLNTSIFYVIVHNVQCISVRKCRIDVKGMFILYRHC